MTQNVSWTKGSTVWVRQSAPSSAGMDGGAWRRGTVAAAPAKGAVSVALDPLDGRGAVEVVSVRIADVEPANPAVMDGVSDITQLTYLNEPGMLEVLRQRFAENSVYTNAGCVLVAVNPFRSLPLYGTEMARKYNQRHSSEDEAHAEPHVFLTADRAFKQMLATAQSQSVLITGESGAGKTETTKIVMRYLASLAGGTGMEDKVLESNPVLEAFGNAQTLRNKNSSRFGKLIEIYFNHGHICGALIHTYLLEKSRVVHQQPGERNYHVFYQLCRGASDAERKQYRLPSGPDSFAYLSSGGCTSIEGVDDADDFAHLKSALTAVGITAEQQAAVFSVLAAILWMGNVQFRPVHDDAVTVDDASMPALRHAAGLLGCSEAALLSALTTRRMQVGGEQIVKELNMDAAQDTRDALSKAIYAVLFKWLVQQINAALSVGKQRSETTLSLLDIAGFESFKENSFEQLCINYANERLQQQFSKHMFKVEQNIYESEAIDWAHVEFVDNQDCVDLFELRPPSGIGILSLLDEECMMPKGSDSTFAAKLQQQQAAHPRFGYNAKAPSDNFTVHHYAGSVTYSCAKFLDKNRDTLSKDLVALLQDSSAALVKLLAGEMQVVQQDRKQGSQTVGARFRDQLRDLMQRLDATALHFVRCIKPNSRQEASKFDPALVLHQLRCCGVLEVARIAQAGYPTRYLHHEFATRYKDLLPHKGAGREGDSLEVCKRLLAHFKVDPAQYQIGRTRLFFRTGVLGRLEDAATQMLKAALLIQSTWRMVRRRRAFLQARNAATCIQSAWRGHLVRRQFAVVLREHRAAVRIQAAVRGCMQRRRYRRALQGVVAIQMAWRRHMLKERVVQRRAERRRAEEARKSQAKMQAQGHVPAQGGAPAQGLSPSRPRPNDTLEAIQNDFGVDAGEIRRVLGLWKVHGAAFLTWRQKAGGSPSSNPPPTTDDSGLLLEIAASHADEEQVQRRLEGLQSYCHKLERNVDDLKEEKHLLQRALHTLQTDPATAAHCQAVLASTMSPRSKRRGNRDGSQGQLYAVHADGTAPQHDSRRHTDSQDDDASSISLMSLNDDDDMSTPGGAASLTAASLAAARQESCMVVNMLGREFDKKQALLLDDADFIREVRIGEADAPGMDPEIELERLVARYRSWKKDFKGRLSKANRVFKQLRKEERKLGCGAGLATSHAGNTTAGGMQPRSSSVRSGMLGHFITRGTSKG